MVKNTHDSNDNDNNDINKNEKKRNNFKNIKKKATIMMAVRIMIKLFMIKNIENGFLVVFFSNTYVRSILTNILLT